ncbi:MAG: tetratricopeptide repeat protein, partial [Pseudomonadota bacterium]
AKTLENINTPEAHYNRGNALAKLGQFPEALDAYEKALKLDPANADARYNKDLVEKLLRQNRQRQQGGHGGGQGNQTQANSDNSGQQGADSGSEHRPAGQSGKEAQKETLDTSSSSGSTPKPQGGQPGASNETRKTPDAGSLDGTDEDGETGSLGKENSEPEEHGNSANPMQSEGESSADEESQQASEQWLRRIPDDPGGLLRRKFEYQYKRRNYQRNSESETW